jgi:hypothetical protein
MTKILFARVPLNLYLGLVSFCSEETIATGSRVCMRGVVQQAIEEYLARQPVHEMRP